MTWTEPKIDWVANDYVNVSDWNRWVGNLQYLNELATRVYKEVSQPTLFLKSRTELPFASQFNDIQTYLTTINKVSYNFEYTKPTIYDLNDLTPNFDVFNEIETLTLRIYIWLESEFNNEKNLEFTLGNEGFE